MELNDVVWRKARRSAEHGGDCVEVASVTNTVAVRDSKDPNGPKLTMPRHDFQRFTEALKSL